MRYLEILITGSEHVAARKSEFDEMVQDREGIFEMRYSRIIKEHGEQGFQNIIFGIVNETIRLSAFARFVDHLEACWT